MAMAGSPVACELEFSGFEAPGRLAHGLSCMTQMTERTDHV
jgi:hypothetical protein